MKLLLSLVVLIAAVITLGLWTNHRLEASTGKLLQHIDLITEDVKKDDWEGAMKKTARLESAWRENERWWPTVLDHQEMDNIDFALSRVKEYVSTRNSPLSRGQLSELRVMFGHIPEKEKVTLQNIF